MDLWPMFNSGLRTAHRKNRGEHEYNQTYSHVSYPRVEEQTPDIFVIVSTRSRGYGEEHDTPCFPQHDAVTESKEQRRGYMGGPDNPCQEQKTDCSVPKYSEENK
jgi:hypothetical protein